MKKRSNGQSLIEVVIGITIGTLILGTAAGAILLTLRTGSQSKSFQAASILSQALLDSVTSVAEKSWHDIYNLSPKGLSAKYYLSSSSGVFVSLSDVEEVTADGAAYMRYFTVENVLRDAGDNIVDVGGAEDPSTQKITAVTEWVQVGGIVDVKMVKYLTRSQNSVFRQSDWSGGNGQTGAISDVNNKFDSASNIDFTSAPGSIKIQGY
ncbi:MAG: hypothetical protein A2745_02605 [Candidatus Harrisonbacteria bacterium RIFCSPHIGHO2_01_FULL_44_13]|uniref:Uncharacterized protein n=1 Tax=Candidatus Harrisonbacteria bacterium RIFCSPLOWO2_01_FULL_44_18 TaxID=1798407 RepID=A0A1G1ZRC5_9BACT|nr:MAG: hypothetical protein A2745_02605 [Candidatus Harrisonbacteria bacterium RIFCSPHIGHO2_01_FULL_44_13]OGY66300.1 MAG: hypothetical protein A3A16_00105 [Candidatus Harrisonbacteria bacterium RIFCSPLOWO2_01_FULL_44_18]